MDYILNHEVNDTIIKIKMLDKIDAEDLRELERILWYELGTKEDYFNVTNQDNLAAFIRSIVGIEQDAINMKFSEYLNTNLLSSKQQEFVKSIINYVRQNGDITREDLVEKSPFKDIDFDELFNDKIEVVLKVIKNLNESIIIN
jgi:type I restriction enzyme R subunit